MSRSHCSFSRIRTSHSNSRSMVRAVSSAYRRTVERDTLAAKRCRGSLNGAAHRSAGQRQDPSAAALPVDAPGHDDSPPTAVAPRIVFCRRRCDATAATRSAGLLPTRDPPCRAAPEPESSGPRSGRGLVGLPARISNAQGRARQGPRADSSARNGRVRRGPRADIWSAFAGA